MYFLIVSQKNIFSLSESTKLGVNCLKMTIFQNFVHFYVYYDVYKTWTV